MIIMKKKLLLSVVALAIVGLSAANLNFALTKDYASSGLKLENVESLASAESDLPVDFRVGYSGYYKEVRDNWGELIDIWCCWSDSVDNACNFNAEESDCGDYKKS